MQYSKYHFHDDKKLPFMYKSSVFLSCKYLNFICIVNIIIGYLDIYLLFYYF